MSLTKPPQRQNTPFHSVNPAKANPLLSLRALPFLVVLASGLALQPVARAQVLTTISVDSPSAKSLSISGLVTNPDQTTVYVADFKKSRIAVIDVSTNQLTGFISTSKPPVGLAISPDGSTLYVTESPSSLEAISVPAGVSLFSKKVGTSPSFPGISPDGSTVYVPATNGTVTTVGGPLNKSIKVLGEPFQAVFTPDGSKAFVSNLSGYISVIDTATGSFTNIGTAPGPVGLVINGNTLYATSLNKVFVIDTTTNSIIRTIPVSLPASTLLALPAVTSDGGFLYLPALEASPTAKPSHFVDVVNTATGALDQVDVVGRGPLQIAIADIPGYVYVSNAFSGTVTVLSLF